MKRRGLYFASIIAIATITVSGFSQAAGGKGSGGHPIMFEPQSISAELALNGSGRQTVAFTSQETLQDVAVWVVPEIYPFVTVEPASFDTIEAGQVYELSVSVSVPEGTMPGYYGGTIHLRDGNRTVAKPLPVSIAVLDELLPESYWPYRRYDLTGSACNPNGSTVYAGNSLTFDFSIPGTDHYVLTGDVDGDGEVEIVTTSGSILNIYDGNGVLENTIALPRDCQLSMLEDADGDGILDIGLGGRGHGFAGYIYKADGTLLKTLTGLHGGSYGDHSMIPLTISNGKVLVGYNAGYSRTPRGVASFDYATGIEEWYYQIGPANGWYSVVDMDADGVLDITMNSHTVHNGASGNGTTDGDIYLVVVDENGANSITQKYPSPSNGWAMHMFADMDGDGIQEVLGFEGHDPRYYPGQAQIHIYDSLGNTLHTFNGPYNTGWDYAVGDLDNDSWKEVVASARNADTLYILDNQLQPIDSAAVAGRVKLVCDLTGDGYKEIVLLDDSGWLRVLDTSLNLIAEVQCGNKNGNVIASDVNSDGIVELLVQTDQLYVYSFAEAPIIAIINPDHHRTLKMGCLNGDGSVFYSISQGTVSDGGEGGWVPYSNYWSNVGTAPDFIGSVLESVGYDVDYYEASSMPDLDPDVYDAVIVQDPLREHRVEYPKSAEITLPDLLDHCSDAGFLSRIDAYVHAGGSLILVGDAVRLLENGAGRLNYGKTVQVESPLNSQDMADPRIPDHWLFIRGNPFCGRDRNGSGEYYVDSSPLLPVGKLSDVQLFNGNDAHVTALWSESVYSPTDAVSLLDARFTGSGEYVLSGAVCSPPVYLDSVDAVLPNYMGYTDYDGHRIYYMGSDALFDYTSKNYAGAWHAGQYLLISNTLTPLGREAIVSLVGSALK